MTTIRYRVVQTTLPAEQPLDLNGSDGVTFQILNAEVFSVGEHVTWTYITRQEVEGDDEADAPTPADAGAAAEEPASG